MNIQYCDCDKWVDGENQIKIIIPILKMTKYPNNKKKDETLYLLFFSFFGKKYHFQNSVEKRIIYSTYDKSKRSAI